MEKDFDNLLEEKLNKAFEYGVQATLDNLLLRGYDTKAMLKKECLGERLDHALDKAKNTVVDLKTAFEKFSIELNLKEVKSAEEMERNIAIKNHMLKYREQETENEILKEIIKSLFDNGCPLHQYIDKDFGLTIEVDNECSIMHLGEYKGVDLDNKLKEVLE